MVGAMLSGAVLAVTAGTAAAATPAATLAGAAVVQPALPPHRCQGGHHWRNRWHDGHGWHNAGCF
jgi:hypothetical protein